MVFRADIAALNSAPVCGRMWFNPAQETDYWDEEDQSWQPLERVTGHVCYEAQHSQGEHRCWCGLTATEH